MQDIWKGTKWISESREDLQIMKFVDKMSGELSTSYSRVQLFALCNSFINRAAVSLFHVGLYSNLQWLIQISQSLLVKESSPESIGLL